jgi:tetratricopeptide (TPR) repeat protein
VLETVFGPTPGAVLLSGAAGMGKSRLIGEVASRCAVPLLYTRAFLPEREEAWAVGRPLLEQALALDIDAAHAVSERAAQALANVVPELEEVRTIGAAALDAESGRALALQAAVRLLGAAACRGLLLVVDDLQWADPTSLAFLGRALRRVHALGAVLAYRPEDVSPDSPVGSFLDDLRSLSRTKTVTMCPFSVQEIAELIADDELVAALATETTATPLTVAEVIRILAAQGAVELDRHRRWRARMTSASEIARQAARAGERRAIQDRVRAQTSGRRQVLSLLALLGRETSARVLASATLVDQPEVLADLDALARVGLVRLGEEGWAPGHDVVADSVTALLERAERGRLHALLARALQSEDAEPSEVAKQLEGAGDVQAAAEAFAEAARHSLGRFASAEAEQLAIAGLRNAHQPLLRVELLELRAEARARRGDLSGARDDLRGALALIPDGPRRAHLLARTAMLISGSEDYAYAGELVELALNAAASDPPARAEALATGAVLDFNTNELDRAQARSSEALALFEQVGDAQGSAEVLDVNAMIAMFEGRFREAVSLLGRVVRLFEDSGRLLRLVIPRAFRGQALALTGQAEDGLVENDRALELARTLGDLQAEGYCLGVRAFTLVSLRRPEEARKNAVEALDIGRRLGHREISAGSLCFIGLAHEAAGAIKQAEVSFRECLREATGLPLFSSLAASGLARVLIASGDLAAAREYLDRALGEGPPSALYDARLAAVELAVAEAAPDSYKLAAEALSLADTGGHALSIPRLTEVLRQLDQGSVADNQPRG